MNGKFVLEVSAYNIQSCLIAQLAGIPRIELCENHHEGGLTPSYGLIKEAREKVTAQLFPIIRPRPGNFLYTDTELSIIKKDIEAAKELGCDGISVGVHHLNCEIDVDNMKRIVEWAYPMSVTCHRVFDFTPDPFRALEDIITTGCDRILTSGQQLVAADGIDLLAPLVKAAGSRISVMPAAGVRSSNIEHLIRKTGAREFHTSARKRVYDEVRLHNSSVMYLGQMYIVDENELRSMLSIGNKMLSRYA